MRRKLAWLALAAVLAVPASLAWAAAGGETDTKEHSSCCCCDTSCPKK